MKIAGSRDRLSATGHRRAIMLAMAALIAMLAGSFGAQVMISDRLHATGAIGDVQLLGWIDWMGGLAIAGQLVGGAITLTVLIVALRFGDQEALARLKAMDDATEVSERVQQLFRMTEMLQSAAGYSDATSVLRATSNRLLPDFGGALYIFNNSRDRLDLCASWNIPGEFLIPPAIAPTECWALKRGKPHLNGPAADRVCCEHEFMDGLWILEIPMLARGEVYGLINFGMYGDDAEERMLAIQPMAAAIADGMSLALANIGLRDKLRNQALRDSLTGLYNRRYMEDMLERFGHIAERNQSHLSAIMIDLDHFKDLNDEHGHAMGDAVLRAVAVTIAEGLRTSDIACRYGGEELLVLMPDCTLEQAKAKAESLRARIEGLSEVYNVQVTGSFGVASLFETTKDPAHLLSDADGALYQAKQAGRNQVMLAIRRNEPIPLGMAAE